MASDSKRPRAAAPAQSAKRHRSMDSEQSARLLLIGAAVAVVAIAVGFVAFGWYWTEYRPRFRTVLEVEGQKVSFEAMQRRIEYEYFSNIALQSDPGVLPTVAYSNLVEEKLLLARAGELGVTAEDAEVETKLRQRVGVAADASNEDFGERYRDVLDVSGLTDGEYRNIAVSEVLKEKVLTKFTLETANSLEQAQLDVILTASESDAQAAIARINSGEAWDAVAKDVSLESDVQVTGGRKGYTPSGGFIPAYDDYAFTGAVGAVSAPLRASDTEWYVVRIVDRSLQPLTEEQKNDVARTKYDEWVVGLRETASIIDNWTTDTEAQIEALTPIIERGTQPVQRQPVATIAVPTLAPATPAAPPAPADGQ